jgi:hypothetical protein
MSARRPDRPMRPSTELVAAQRAGKLQWRRAMVHRPFKEKILLLLDMQKRLHPVIARRRALESWERPWAIDG